VEKELEDRYGKVPDEVRNLIEYSALKSVAEKAGIEAVDRRHSILNVKFHKEARVDPSRLMNIVSGSRGAQFTPAGVLVLPLDGRMVAGEILQFVREKLEQLQPPEPQLTR
jgi:transcription-repair coupling factor (superfamily II helicase)